MIQLTLTTLETKKLEEFIRSWIEEHEEDEDGYPELKEVYQKIELEGALFGGVTAK